MHAATQGITVNTYSNLVIDFLRKLGNYSVAINEDLEVGKDTGIQLHVDDLDDG